VAVTANIDFADGAGVPNLDVAWIHGSEAAKYNTDPDIQVHACDEHTYILRQNKAVHYEAPFMFLLFGAAKAVLLDHPLKHGMDWTIQNQTWFLIVIVLLSVLPTLVMIPLCYRRERSD